MTTQKEVLEAFEQRLLSMESLDRTSPELWPEQYPGMSNFVHSFTPPTATKLPYSKELTEEDQKHLNQLGALSTMGLISRVKELHDIAYRLGLKEAKEMTRGKYLNIFKARQK